MAPPPLLKPTPRPCHIKTTAPSNLATAFGEQQWVTAANLAKQRYRTTKDPYYLAVEIAAKSQSDNLTDRNAGKIAVENMVKENVTISDADTLDMYELSCYYLNVKYSETIGVLRGRLVKALPKDQNACTRCFDACVWFSDWKNAQQIAASLNKNFVNDRKFLFRYIMATHLYSTSQDCPDGSRKIFSSLAKAQADKAFDLRVMTAGEEYHVNRAVLTDAEVWLWLDIRIIHSTQKENLELFRRSEYSPLRFLESGQYDLFWKAYKYLQACDASDDIIQIGKHILITATHRFQSEADAIEKDADVINLRKLASAEDNQQSPVEISSVKTKLDRAIAKARPARSSEDNYYVAATCDYQMLFIMLNEIQSQPDNKRLMKQTNNSIDKLTRALKRADCMRPIFQRSLSIVSLAAIFHRDSTPDLALGNPMTTRVTCLVDYINQGFDNPNLLLETLLFIRELSAPEIEACVSSLYNIGTKSADSFKRFMLAALCSKIRYTVAGNPKLATCGFCNTELKGNDCVSCLKGIAIDALDTYKIGIEDHNLRQDILSRQGENPLSDIAITGAACLLRIARLGSKRSSYGTNSLHHANIQLFLQAVLWLDSCTRTSLPIKSVHSIILTKLYVILGSVVRAKNLWDPYAVKNVLLDSLGLLFIDRLSSITPGLFIMGTSHSNPVEPFMTHFSRGLRVTTPKRIMDSLEMGNYQSIPGIVQFAKKQAASCSLVLTVVEDRRASRMKTGKIELAIEDQALVRDLSIHHELEDVTDYKYFTLPVGENAVTYPGDETTFQSIIHYGPLPSSLRAHLGLLAERFLDFVCYVQSKDYKPSKAGQIIQLDWEYALATSVRLEKDMRTLLGTDDLSLRDERVEKNCPSNHLNASLTGAENWYHQILNRLAYMVKTVVGCGILKASTNDIRDHLRQVVKDAISDLQYQTKDFLEVPENIQSKIHGLHGFAALHAMGMLRETIIAFKHSVNYLTTACDKAKNVDKLRTAAELAFLAPELKKMVAAAVESENTIKARIKLLKAYLDNVDGWRDRLCYWVFGEYATLYDEDKVFKNEVCAKLKATIPRANAELWADGIGESWRELMRGWAAVKFD